MPLCFGRSSSDRTKEKSGAESGVKHANAERPRCRFAEAKYMNGFGNEFTSEALPGALPPGQNNPKVISSDCSPSPSVGYVVCMFLRKCCSRPYLGCHPDALLLCLFAEMPIWLVCRTDIWNGIYCATSRECTNLAI